MLPSTMEYLGRKRKERSDFTQVSPWSFEQLAAKCTGRPYVTAPPTAPYRHTT